MNSFARKLRTAILVAAAGAIVTGQLALAHARLLRSNPEDGAVLDSAPREVFLWFDEPVAAELSAVEVLDANGNSIAEAAPRGDPADATLLVAALPELSNGIYSLAWKVVSNTDSHLTQGTLVFGVGQTGSALARPAAESEAAIPPMEAVLRALNYLSLSLLVGSLTVNGLILRSNREAGNVQDVAQQARRRIWRLGFAAALLAMLVGMAWLAWQSSALGRDPFDGLLTTRFGILWMLRQYLLLGLLIAMIYARQARAWGWRVAGLLVAGLALLQALNGHAAGLPQNSELAVAADALHLLAAGAWVGSMLALLAGLLPLLRSRRADVQQIALNGWRRFGVVAALSVATLAATGLYNAARQVATVDAWIGTPHGQILAGKLGLFAFVGLAGLLNSAILHPRLSAVLARMLRRPWDWRPIPRARLPQVLLAEAVMGVLIFAASGWMTAAPPARGPEFLPPDSSAKPPSSLTLPVDDLLVSLSIRPNKPGTNIVTVDALNTRRPAPAETLRVLIRLTYEEQDRGTQTLIAEAMDEDTHRLNTNALSLAGAWRAQVVVRRAGLEDSVADFDWQVASLAPSLPPRPVVVSNAPLETPLTVLAVLILAGAGLAAVVWRRLSHTRMEGRRDTTGEAPVTYRAESRLIQ